MYSSKLIHKKAGLTNIEVTKCTRLGHKKTPELIPHDCLYTFLGN